MSPLVRKSFTQIDFVQEGHLQSGHGGIDGHGVIGGQGVHSRQSLWFSQSLVVGGKAARQSLMFKGQKMLHFSDLISVEGFDVDFKLSGGLETDDGDAASIAES